MKVCINKVPETRKNAQSLGMQTVKQRTLEAYLGVTDAQSLCIYWPGGFMLHIWLSLCHRVILLVFFFTKSGTALAPPMSLSVDK